MKEGSSSTGTVSTHSQAKSGIKTVTKPAATRKPRSSRSRYCITPWLFLSPAILLFFGVFIIPIIYTAWQSLYKIAGNSGTGFNVAREPIFVGLDQYMASLQDSSFLWSIFRVITIGIVQVPIMLFFALCLALMLDSRRCFGRKVFNLLYFLPYAIPGVVSALMWAYLVQPSLSPFTQASHSFGFNFDMTTSSLVPFTIGNMITWGYTGYNMIIMYAALKALPADIMEAATIDGAKPWQVAWKIKVPLIRPAIVMTAVFSIIGTIQLYNEPAILRNSTPNVDVSFTPIMDVYTMIQNNDFNGAAARSIILAVLAFTLSYIFLKIQQRRGGAF